MNIRTSWVLLMLFGGASVYAQQTIYWKKDHIYAGPGGKEIAIVTPAPTDQIAPTAPTGLSASNITATSAQLSWSASTDTGGSNLAGYKVYRQVGTGASLPVGSVGPGSLGFTDQHLQPNTNYTFTIVSFDNAQNHSAASNAVTLTTLAAGADTTAPTTPGNLVASLAARTTVRLDWYPSTDIGGTGIAGYRVYRGGSLISGPNPISARTYQDSGLSYRTAYSYTVVAVDNANNASTASAAANITTDWELLIQDEFSRPDSGYLNSSNWYAGSAWQISSTRAYTYGLGNGGAAPPVEAYAAAWLTDTRVTLDLVASTNALATGVVFWHGSPTLYHQPSYRVRATAGLFGSIYLEYFGDDWTQSVTLAATSPSNAVGTLRVEAISATRNIKVYFNGVLQIDYTDTNTLRPNSGYAGMNANLPSSPPSTTTVDNFLLER